ncbi:MAG: hypothetical protein ACRD96_05990 [Bryobacteraceae bacterium]
MRRRDLICLVPTVALAAPGESGWTKSSKNPMLSLGRDGDFDSQNIFAPSVIREGQQYYLFYAGGPLGPRNGGELVKYQLGLALSRDGETWK